MPARHVLDLHRIRFGFGHAGALAIAREAKDVVVAAVEPDRRLPLGDEIDDVVFRPDVVPEAEERADAAFLRTEVELFGGHPLDGLVEESVHRLQ